MSTIALLRSRTTAAHRRLERRLDIQARFSSRLAYACHLSRMWGFYAALEAPLRSGLFKTALSDYEARRKLPLLIEDLVALGSNIIAVQSLPQCEVLPDCEDSPAALGCLYVMEGATLGGRILLPMVEKHLGCSATRGATFLASYGDQIGEMWRRFCVSLDSGCEMPVDRERAAAAAVSTFELLEQWLCGSSIAK